MQACGRLGRAGEVVHARADALDRLVAEAREARVREQREEPPLGVERGPVRRGVVRQRQRRQPQRRPRAAPARARTSPAARRARLAAPRLAARGGVAPKSSAPAAWTSARPAPNAAGSPRDALVDPVEHEHALAHAEHLGHAQRARLAQPAQRRRLGRVLPRRDVRAGLDEPERLVLELHAVGLVDVTAADPLQAPHRPAGGLADRVLQVHRSVASRPRQAASTWSSTVSKPSGPP